MSVSHAVFPVIDNEFRHNIVKVTLAEFILGTNYPSDTNFVSETGNSSA